MFLHSPNRRGVTLVEVMMAMFVMAIGMLALLVLFPVGLYNVRWAIDNNRIGSIAANAEAMIDLPQVNYDDTTGLLSTTQTTLRNDPRIRPDGNATLLRVQSNNISAAALNTITSRTRALWNDSNYGGKWTFTTTINPPPVPIPDYITTPLPYAGAAPRVVFPPVFVDPNVVSNPTWRVPSAAYPFPYHVGGGINQVGNAFHYELITTCLSTAGCRTSYNLGIPRCDLSGQLLSSLPPRNGTGEQSHIVNSESHCEDEIVFGIDSLPGQFQDARPILPTTVPVNRDRRFTFAYLCRWHQYGISANSGAPTSHDDFCDVSIAMFNGRPNGGGVSNVPVGESSFKGINASLGLVFRKGSTEAIVALPDPVGVPAKAGDWVFDNTLIMPEYHEPTGNTAPFLDRFDPEPRWSSSGGAPFLRAGLVGGHFYQIAEVGPIQYAGVVRFQRIVLTRPARSDGFVAVFMKGLVDVIEKGIGSTNAK